MRYLAPDFVVRSFLDITPEDVRELSPDSLAICVDIDGTVTDFHAPEVPADAQAQLRSFSDAGFLTFIVSNCSGRRVTEVHRLFDDLVTGVVTPFDCLGPEDDDDTGRSHRKPAPDMLLAVAARVGTTRLIDNTPVLVGPGGGMLDVFSPQSTGLAPSIH